MTGPGRLVTLAQAGAYARVSARTVRGWAERGLIELHHGIGPGQLDGVSLNDIDNLITPIAIRAHKITHSGTLAPQTTDTTARPAPPRRAAQPQPEGAL